MRVYIFLTLLAAALGKSFIVLSFTYQLCFVSFFLPSYLLIKKVFQNYGITPVARAAHTILHPLLHPPRGVYLKNHRSTSIL